MTKSRQLATTVGLSHDGFQFLEGPFEGLEGYAVSRMTKSRPGRLYIDDAGWGPEAGSVEYGYRVPFGGIHVFMARSVNRALSQTFASTSSKRLSVRDLPGLNRP